MSEFLGIVGSQEKDPDGKDVSLEHYRRSNFIEVFCREALFADFSSGIGVLVRIRKGAQVWEGEMFGFRMGVLSSNFTPMTFFRTTQERESESIWSASGQNSPSPIRSSEQKFI